MNILAFIKSILQNNRHLANWFYMLGVTGQQFEDTFQCPQYKNIQTQVATYDRYSMHLRKVLQALDDDNVHAYIKIPQHSHDNIIYGYLHRISDNRFLSISYNGVDGIQLSNYHNLILGGMPPVNMHPELCGNYRFIDKAQRDLAFQYAASNPPDITTAAYERISDGTLTDQRLWFLATICVKSMLQPGIAEQTPNTVQEVKDILSNLAWTKSEIQSLLTDAGVTYISQA